MPDPFSKKILGSFKVSSDQSADGLPVDTKPEEDKPKGKYIEIKPIPEKILYDPEVGGAVTFSVRYM